MKTLFCITLTVILNFSAFSQADYVEAMANALKEFGNAKTSEEMKETAAKFERIATAEPEKWLPLYYSSFIQCIMSFHTKETETKQQLLNHAQKKMDEAMEINSEESELHTLQGMLYQSMITIDPQNNGAVYGGKANGSFEIAKKLNPENPRPEYLQAVSLFYTPEQYGGGKEAALPLLEEALAKFEVFEPVDSLYPDWGKEDCKRQIEACKAE